MDRTKIILNMLGRGAIYGAGLGALFGCAFGTPLMIFGGLLVVLFGLGVGFGIGLTVGAVDGLFAGIIASLFFYPLKNTRDYRLSITLICMILSAILVPFAVQWAWIGHFTWKLPSAWTIFAFMAMIAGLVLSKWLTTWYVRKNGIYQSTT